jgi:CheY-like chemotaxis protein
VTVAKLPLGRSFYLPLTSERSVTPDPAAQPVEASSARSSRQTILVVDDEDTLRFVIRRLLEEAGYGVVEAGNGLQALGQLNDPRAAIRAVLSDIRMPVMDGWELTARSSPGELPAEAVRARAPAQPAPPSAGLRSGRDLSVIDEDVVH